MRGEFVGIAEIERHGGGEEGHGVVRLEPGGVIADQGIGGGVGFVEAVFGEALHEVEDLAGRGGGHALAGGTLDEGGALALHFLHVFFAHGAAQQVGAAEGEAGHDLGDLHHLFLIDHDAIGLGQDGVDGGVRAGPGLAMLAGAIGGDIGHGAGAVERDGGDEVFQPIGPHRAQAVAHALAFELEHPGGVASGQHGVGFGVVEGDFGEVNHHPLPGQQFQGAL